MSATMPAPTPSPLRRMALGASVPKVSKPRPRSDIEAMPPPAPPATRRSQLGRKRVLEEDDYVDALDAIIERDFFPNLPVLQRRLRWLQLHGAGGATSTPGSTSAPPTDPWQSSGNGGGSNRATLAAQLATPVSEWGDDSEPSATPLRGGASAASGGGSSGNAAAAAAGAGGAPGAGFGAGAAATALSLTDFVRHNVSEDHESFQEVLEADQERHRRKFFWAFDGGVGSGAGTGGNAAPQLMLLKDGTAMTAERRALADAACEPEAMLGDSRPGVLDTWKHRVRNQLMFGAEMAISREICGVPGAGPLLLTDGGGGGPAGRGIGADGGGKVIQHHATRFPPPEVRGLTPGGSSSGASSIFGGYEAPNSERSSVAGLEGLQEASAARRKERNDVLVAMTPSPMPGFAGDSPMMTWGAIAGTPLVLDPTKTPLPGGGPGGDDGYGGYGDGGYGSGGGDSGGGSRFRLNEQPRREALAHELDAATRKKRKTGGAASAGGAGATAATAAAVAGAKPLTPAARAFAARLAKTRQPGGETPFGGALSTPKRAAVAADGGSATAAAARGRAATPLPSPAPLARGGTPVVSARASSGAKASRITDGLLKL